MRENSRLLKSVQVSFLIVLFFVGFSGILLVIDTYLSWNYCYRLGGRSPYKSHIDCYVNSHIYNSDIVDKRPPTIFGYIRFHLETQELYPYEYRVLTIQNNHLILLKHYLGTSSICDNSWIQESGLYFQIDLSDAQLELVPYVVPLEKFREQQDIFQKCVKGIE